MICIIILKVILLVYSVDVELGIEKFERFCLNWIDVKIKISLKFVNWDLNM